ncbi:MAG TPA: 2TM domain-containing protein [Candidatus Sulfotelmatobacter sp.]|nr:2TM domain-containing protein [Candidatus Sulfotelmatobacter sp.]
MQNQKITQTKIEQSSLEKQAYEAKKGFKINLTAYVAVNSVLVTINMLTVPQFPWFLFPMCGWGFGVTMHYILRAPTR